MNALTYRATRREKSYTLRAAAWLRANCGALVAVVGVIVIMALGAHITGDKLRADVTAAENHDHSSYAKEATNE